MDNKEKFIEKAKKKHGDTIDFSKVEYVNSTTKVCLICRKKDKYGVEHGEYWQVPASCTRGIPCPKCGNEKRGPRKEDRMTTEKYILEERKVHGYKYDLSKAVYVDADAKMCFICPEHGEFWQLPYGHLSGQGCPKCSGKNFTQDEIIEEFRKVHGTKYDYSKVEFKGFREKVCIICPEHGEFYQTIAHHLRRKQGCPECSGLKRHTLDEFIEKSNKIHGNKYDYSKVEYSNNKTNVCIICPEHGEFWQSPFNHFHGHGCPKCVNTVSKPENDLGLFIEGNLGMTVDKSRRDIIPPYELDMYIQDKKIAIEFDGLYWHNEKNVDNNYHRNKTRLCQENGVRLIHIFEDEWLGRREIVESRLKNILGVTGNKVYARKCEVREVSPSVSSDFLDKNHIQGKVSGKYKYGLYHNGELVSIMVFGSLRKNLGSVSKDGEFELLRFCNKLDTTVIGGASKLLKHFIKAHSPKRIVSYADKRWSDGNMYRQLGFDWSHDSEPSYFYIFGTKRENRFKYRKSELIKQGFDASKSEHDIMLERGIYRIYDCGCMVFEWNSGKNGDNVL